MNFQSYSLLSFVSEYLFTYFTDFFVRKESHPQSVYNLVKLPPDRLSITILLYQFMTPFPCSCPNIYLLTYPHPHSYPITNYILFFIS